jgi:hypothetical protein
VLATIEPIEVSFSFDSYLIPYCSCNFDSLLLTAVCMEDYPDFYFLAGFANEKKCAERSLTLCCTSTICRIYLKFKMAQDKNMQYCNNFEKCNLNAYSNKPAKPVDSTALN